MSLPHWQICLKTNWKEEQIYDKQRKSLQIDDALNARELIKGNVLENSMLSAREVAEELAAKTASQVVQVIGNRFILYRRTEKNLCEM